MLNRLLKRAHGIYCGHEKVAAEIQRLRLDLSDLQLSLSGYRYELQRRGLDPDVALARVKAIFDLAPETEWSHEVIPEGVPVYVRESEAGGYEWRRVEEETGGQP